MLHLHNHRTRHKRRNCQVIYLLQGRRIYPCGVKSVRKMHLYLKRKVLEKSRLLLSSYRQVAPILPCVISKRTTHRLFILMCRYVIKTPRNSATSTLLCHILLKVQIQSLQVTLLNHFRLFLYNSPHCAVSSPKLL